MAIDVQTLAEQSFELAKSLVPQAFRTVRVRLGPTMDVYDSVNDTRPVDTWNFDSSLVIGLTIKALGFDDEKERADQPVEARMRVWMLSLDDLTAIDDLDLDTQGIITDLDEAPDIEWDIYRTEIDPSKSIVLFYCRA